MRLCCDWYTFSWLLFLLREIQSAYSVRGSCTLEAGSLGDGGVFWHCSEIIMSKVHPEDMSRLSVRLRAGHAIYQFRTVRLTLNSRCS